jgi:predicted Ser/Thr protein kinase
MEGPVLHLQGQGACWLDTLLHHTDSTLLPLSVNNKEVHIEHFLGCGGSVAVFEGKWNGTVSSLIVQLKQLLMHHIMVACEGEEVVVKRFHQGKWQSLVKECENLEKVKQLGLMVTEVGDALVLQQLVTTL